MPQYTLTRIGSDTYYGNASSGHTLTVSVGVLAANDILIISYFGSFFTSLSLADSDGNTYNTAALNARLITSPTGSGFSVSAAIGATGGTDQFAASLVVYKLQGADTIITTTSPGPGASLVHGSTSARITDVKVAI